MGGADLRSMNAAQFNAALAGLINSALVQGIPRGAIDHAQIIGVLELHKAEVIRQLQDSARHRQIVRANIVPPRNGE